MVILVADKRILVFIFEEVKMLEFLKSVKTKNCLVICSNEDLKKKILTYGYNCKTILEYSKNPDEDLQKALEWMKVWPDKIIYNNKSFKELLVYQNISIFWFLETRLYLYRIRDLLLLIENIKRIITLEKPTSIWIKGSHELKHIISEIDASHLHKFESLEKREAYREIKHKSYQGYPTLKLLLLKLFRGLFFTSTQNSKHIEKDRIVVVTEVSNWHQEFDYTSQKYVQKDVFYQDIIKKLKELNYNVIVVDFENRPRQLFKAYLTNRKRQKSFDARVEPWEKYIDFSIIKKSKDANKKILEIWDELKDSNDFKNSLVYEGVSIYSLIKQDINYLFKSLKAYVAVALIETAKKIIEIEKPSIIAMHDEYGALQMALIKAAKEKKIPSLSVQHGIIFEDLLYYSHKPNHVSGKNMELDFPLPDKMCVWSENIKQGLIEFGSFSSSIPVVTGDPKIDFLPKALKFFNYEKITAKLEIPIGKKIIFFATENLVKKEESILVIKSIMKAIKELSNYYLLIKMHPNESDLSFYHKFAKEFEISEYSIVKNYNLYELLYIADVVIVSYSTVGVEAMRMKKPVIALNLMGIHDAVPLIRKKIALVVRKENDLLPVIRKCLDPKFSKNFVENGKIFAEQEIGIADGNAVKRIVDVILKLKKNNIH